MNSIRYPLANNLQERRRLEIQSRLFNPATEAFFKRAGIRPGMRVLDVGCGIGEVSAVVAQIVGPRGSVLGVDSNRPSLDQAVQRWQDLHQVRFEKFDLSAEMPEGPFDAVVGRLVLMYIPNPVGFLVRLKGVVKPGGIIAFQESDHQSFMRTEPFSNLYEIWRRRIMETAERCGVHLNLGLRLSGLFEQAGLSSVVVDPRFRVDGGTDSEVYDLFAMTVQSMGTKMVREGLIRSKNDIPSELAWALREEAAQRKLAVYTSTMIGVAGLVPAKRAKGVSLAVKR